MRRGSRTVLFVCYEFPPTGGAGVQRLAKFARYLPQSGWSAVVLAAGHVPGRAVDETLMKDVAGVRVVRTPARPVNLWVSHALVFARGLRDAARPARSGGVARRRADSIDHAERVSTTGRSGRTERITRWLAVPDFARLWVGPAVRAGVRLGRQAEASVVYASGPPFSALVAGRRIAAALGVPFVADYRDAWRDNPSNSWYPSGWHRWRSLWWERKVLASAAAVTTAHPLAGEITEMGGPVPTLIPNGFDPADLPEWAPAGAGPLTVTFMGAFYGVNHPLPVLRALKAVREGGAGEPREARLRIVGSWPSHMPEVIAQLGLQEAVELHPYLPHHEALGMLASSDVGLVVYSDLPELRVSTPAKLYEYLGIGLPILFVGPTEGRAPDLVRAAKAGVIVPYTDSGAIAAAMARFADLKAEGALRSERDAAVIECFDRRSQAARLASVLGSVMAP